MVDSPGFRRLTPSIALFSAAVVLAVAVVAACGADDALPRASEAAVSIVADPPPTSVAPATTELPPLSATETVDARGGPAAPDDTDNRHTATGGPDARPCGPVPDATARIADASARIAPPSRTLPYEWSTIRSDMSTCNQLSWAELTTKGGTASSADQLLLFGPDGRWLGTGIRCTVGLASVRSSGPDHVDVGYAYRRSPTEGTADASGLVVIRFRWNGSEVVMEGELPDALIRDQCSGQQ